MTALPAYARTAGAGKDGEFEGRCRGIVDVFRTCAWVEERRGRDLCPFNVSPYVLIP